MGIVKFICLFRRWKSWFVLSEFKRLRLVAGNRYLYCYGVGEGAVLAVEGRLTVGRLGG